jgi:hypothetical protein
MDDQTFDRLEKDCEMAKRRQKAGAKVRKDDRLFMLQVCIISGPMTEKFIKKNKVICRTIQMRGDQTLEALHRAIFDAFDREEQHMFEFQVGGRGPMDPKARRYVLPLAADDPLGGEAPAGTVDEAIGSLNLKKGDAFGYWFDFGDDWWHQINVVAVEDMAEDGKYPKVTNRVGESPPQYANWDEGEGE